MSELEQVRPDADKTFNPLNYFKFDLVLKVEGDAKGSESWLEASHVQELPAGHHQEPEEE
jgi:hypothetical protein